MSNAANDVDLVVMIMAGGAGTRFWPMSTEERPKQFLNLFGGRSLIQQSYDRVAGLVPDERIMVLTNEVLTGLVREQLPSLPAENVIGEPMRRDTAAAVALAALLARRRWGNPVMAVLTADHLIRPVELFQRTLLSAARAAAVKPVIYTFGVQPNYPATCYGYLERGREVADDDGIGHYELIRFVEKPDAPTAEEYLSSGRYYWNSGMFIWSIETITGELERQLPDHVRHLSRAVEADGTPQWTRALAESFEPLEATSIDFGVMEGAEAVHMLAARFEWNDVGGWLALEEFLDSDSDGNAHRGGLEVLDAGGNLVFCEDESETVALIGVSDLVVVRVGNRTLVATKERVEEIKALVKSLKGGGR